MSSAADSRLVREAQEHLDTVLGTVEAFGAGLLLQTRSMPSTPVLKKATDLPFAHPVKEVAPDGTVIAKTKYMPKHNYPGKGGTPQPTFEERVMRLMPETRKQAALSRIRLETGTYTKLSWEQVLQVQGGKPHKKNRKGNGKGHAPTVSLDKLAAMELK